MGYRRIHGELLALGIKVAASTVWEILQTVGIDPAPQRASTTWAAFLRSQGEAIIAADFLETVTLTGTRLYVLLSSSTPPGAFVFSAPPRTRPQPGSSRPPATSPWICAMPVARSDGAHRHPGARMNSIMERAIQSCRHELLDRTLIWNQGHLLHSLREYERHYNTHRPHPASPTPDR
jgi:hypothetical protein